MKKLLKKEDLKKSKLVKLKMKPLFSKKKGIKLATVFSGIGAIEHALQRMDVPTKLVFACDIDKFAKESYFANYDISEDQWIDDISCVDGNKYVGKVDLFVGGSPCQSFSMVGKRKGLGDERGLLIYEFSRLVNEIQPTVFIWENVNGWFGWFIIK